MFDETRECYICSNACGWIAGKKVRHVPYTLYMYQVSSFVDLSGFTVLMLFELKLHGN